MSYAAIWKRRATKKPRIFVGSRAKFTFNGKEIAFADGLPFECDMDVAYDGLPMMISGKHTSTIMLKRIPNGR